VAFSIDGSNVLYSINSPISGYPFSLAGWFRVPDVSLLTALVGVIDFSTGAKCEIYFAGDAGKQAVARTTNGSSESAYSTSPMIPGVWHHLTAVFSSDSERKIYLDGGNLGVNSGSLSVGIPGFFYFGNLNGVASVDLADVLLIEGAVSEQQATALAMGYPMLLLPSSRDVVAYQNCIRYLNHPGWGLKILSLDTPVVVDHPPMMIPNRVNSITMANRVRGPFRVEEMLYRSLSSAQGQHSSAGVASTNSILSGEVIG